MLKTKTENNPPEKEEPTTKTTKDNDRTQNILDSAPGKREENSLQERKTSLIAAKLENPKLYKLRKQQLKGMSENKAKKKQTNKIGFEVHLLTLPFPPVRTALAIFMSFSLFMVTSDGAAAK
jgi:hypothetical protein